MSKNKKQIINNTNSRSKRRWLNIGPGIVLALAISAFLGSQWIKTDIAAHRQKSVPPIVERQVISSSFEEKSGPTPEVGFILDRAEKLNLTSAQLAQIKSLNTKWKKFYAPKMKEASQAMDKTNKYLANAKGNSRTPVAQIQSAAAPVIALSGEISSARRSYWNSATKILTPEQRKVLQTEREASWSVRK